MKKSIFPSAKFDDFRNMLYFVFMFTRLGKPTKCQYDMANVMQNIVKPRLGMEVDPNFKHEYPLLWDEDRIVRKEIDWENPDDFDELDEGENIPGPHRFIQCQAFRGIGKSLLAEILADWCLAHNKELSIMVASASGARAADFTNYCMSLIETFPPLAKLIPGIKERKSTLKFEVYGMAGAHSPSMRAAGIMGNITGGRADIIIADDVEVPNTSETLTMREKLEQRVQEFDSILKPGGIIIFLGTPQCEDSLYVKLDRKATPRIIWPARYPSDKWMKGNGHALAPLIKKEMDEDPSLRQGGGVDGRMGRPTDPHRFSDTDLKQREAKMGRSNFMLQFMLDTTLADAGRYPLKLKDLIVMDLNSEEAPEKVSWSNTESCFISDLPCVGMAGDGFFREYSIEGQMLPYKTAIMAIDPAGNGGDSKGGDELAYCIIKQLNGILYVMECKGLRGGYSDKNLLHLTKRASKYRVNKIVIEKNFGQGMFSKVLHPFLVEHYPCTIEEVNHNKQKEKRIIDTCEPLMNQHRIVINRQVILDDMVDVPGIEQDDQPGWRLFNQMTRITKEKDCLAHDDRLDAFAMACAACENTVHQNADRKKTEREQKDIIKEIDRLREYRKNGPGKASIDLYANKKIPPEIEALLRERGHDMEEKRPSLKNRMKRTHNMSKLLVNRKRRKWQ